MRYVIGFIKCFVMVNISVVKNLSMFILCNLPIIKDSTKQNKMQLGSTIDFESIGDS